METSFTLLSLSSYIFKLRFNFYFRQGRILPLTRDRLDTFGYGKIFVERINNAIDSCRETDLRTNAELNTTDTDTNTKKCENRS